MVDLLRVAEEAVLVRFSRVGGMVEGNGENMGDGGGDDSRQSGMN